ncbi:MAG: hypothetical protein ABI614_14445 [Planctomycetota bacterium]
MRSAWRSAQNAKRGDRMRAGATTERSRQRKENRPSLCRLRTWAMTCDVMRRKTKVGRAGLERAATSQGKRQILAGGGATGGDIAGDSPQLQAIIDAWPSLPDDVKASIAAMVKAAGE